MIGALAIVLIGPLMLALLVLLTLPFSMFQAWIAAKIWLLLVVPTTGWQPLSWVTIFGVAAVVTCVRLRAQQERRDEHKPDFEREHPFLHLVSHLLVMGLIAPTLIYIVARIVAWWAL